MGLPRRAQLREARGDRAIKLSDAERSAVMELGLRPTYAIVPCDNPEGNVALMLENAVLWLRAADITGAGVSGRLPDTLWSEVAALLDEAIPEAIRDLWNTIHARDGWFDGVAGHGFPGLGRDDTEARYGEYIDGARELLSALQSLDAKLAERMRRSAA